MKHLNIKQGKIWKKYRIHCNHCGSDTYTPYWLLKLHFIFSDYYISHCKICHKKSKHKIMFNTIHDTTDKETKIFNKNKLWDDRIGKD